MWNAIYSKSFGARHNGTHCNPGTQEVEKREYQVWGQHGLHRETLPQSINNKAEPHRKGFKSPFVSFIKSDRTRVRRRLEKMLKSRGEWNRYWKRTKRKPRGNHSPVPVSLACIFILLNSLTVASIENQLAWASLTRTCVLRPKALTQIVIMCYVLTGRAGTNPIIWMQSRDTQLESQTTSLHLALMSYYTPGTSSCRWMGRPPTFWVLHSLLSGALSSMEEPTVLFELTWWCSSWALFCLMMFSFSKSSFCCLSNSSLPYCFQHK